MGCDEWQRIALAAAIERVKHQVNPEQFQMFDLYVLRKVSALEVARLLGTSVAKVYLTKHRLSKLLRNAVCEFEKIESLR